MYDVITLSDTMSLNTADMNTFNLVHQIITAISQSFHKSFLNIVGNENTD